ncbi:MAG: protein-L-isoaspartate O-methyltransferase [Promethearchaeota archaeon]
MENNSMFEAKIQLLFSLIGNGYLKDKRLFKAFLYENIENFIPEEFIFHAGFFNDRPSLFYHQNVDNYRTISAPHMISIMLQGLLINEPNEDLLILGAKSGFIAALAHKLAPEGTITIIEANSEIAQITLDNLKNQHYDKRIKVLVRNPLEGVPELSPWKKILVTGAIAQERIYPLLKQLDPNEGVLFAPIGEEMIQTYTQILRINDDFFGKKQLNVQFSPLMTQVELDELELITDFDVYSEDKANESKKPETSPIEIKYTSSILDEVDLIPKTQLKATELFIKPIDITSIFLKYIDKLLESVKNVNDPKIQTNNIENIETLIQIFEKFKDKVNINIKKIRSSFNQINSHFKNNNGENLHKIFNLIDEFQKIIRIEIEKFKN